MKWVHLFCANCFVLSFIAVLVINTSCKKDPNDGIPTNSNNPGNAVVTKCPVAKAGPDTTISFPQNYLTLNGSGSYDSLNRPLKYEWRMIGAAQPDSMLMYAHSPFVSGFREGSYSLQLKVTAGTCSTYDTVKVTVLGATYCQQNREQIPVQLNLVAELPVNVQSLHNFIFATNNKLIVVPHDIFYNPSIYIYDQVSLQWTSTQLSNVRDGMGIIATGTKIYFAGGMLYNNSGNMLATTSRVDIYNLATQTWAVSNLAEPRAFVKAIALENHLFFAGGMKSDRTFSNKMDIYDVSLNSWATASLPGRPRAIIGATTINNKLFFCGGYTEFANYTGFGEILNKEVKDIDIYDALSGTWTSNTMQRAKIGFATASFNNKLILAGGIIDGNQDGSPETLDYTVEIKDLNSSINQFACIFQPNTFNFCNVVEKNNQLVFMGDNSFTSTVSGKIDIYNMQSGIWKIGLLPANIISDSYTTSAVSVNNQIYVVHQGKIYTMIF